MGSLSFEKTRQVPEKGLKIHGSAGNRSRPVWLEGREGLYRSATIHNKKVGWTWVLLSYGFPVYFEGLAITFFLYRISHCGLRLLQLLLLFLPSFLSLHISLILFLCFSLLSSVQTKRYPHYRPWRPTGYVDARVHIFTAMALGRGRVASPTLDRLYPLGNPPYSFYRRLSGPQDQSGHERAKKNLHPLRHPGLNQGRPARSPAPCRLSYLAHPQSKQLLLFFSVFLGNL